MAESLILQLKARGVTLTKKQLDKLDTSAKKAGMSMKTMVAAVGGVYALGKAFSYVVGVGKEFSSAQSNLAAIVGKSKDQLGALDKTAKQLGATTKFTATQVVELQTEYAKLGFTSEQIVNAQEATLALASAVNVDLATAATTAGQTINAFGLQAEDTQRVVDVMALSFSSSALDMDKFTNSMTYVSVVAKQSGLSVEATTGVLGKLADVGISGSIAGTALRRIFLEMGNEASKLSKKVGFAVKSDEDLFKALKMLNKEGLSTAQMEDLVGKRAISAFGSMLQMAEGSEELSEALEGAAGTAQKMADEQLDNLEGDMFKLTSATQGFSLELYESFEPSLRSAAQAMTALVGALDSDVFVDIIAIAGYGALAYAGWTLQTWILTAAKMGLIASLAKAKAAYIAFAMSTGGTLLALAAVGTIIHALSGGFDKVIERSEDFSESIKNAAKTNYDSFSAFSGSIAEVEYDFEKAQTDGMALIVSNASKDIQTKQSRKKELEELIETDKKALEVYTDFGNAVQVYGESAETVNQIIVASITNIKHKTKEDENALALANKNIKTIKDMNTEFGKTGKISADSIFGTIWMLETLDDSLNTNIDTHAKSTEKLKFAYGGVQRYYTEVDAGLGFTLGGIGDVNKLLDYQSTSFDKGIRVYTSYMDNAASASDKYNASWFLREKKKSMLDYIIESAENLTKRVMPQVIHGVDIWNKKTVEYTTQFSNTAEAFTRIQTSIRDAFKEVPAEAFDKLFESIAKGDKEELTKWLQTYNVDSVKLMQTIETQRIELEGLEQQILDAKDADMEWKNLKETLREGLDKYNDAVTESRDKIVSSTIATLANKHTIDKLSVAYVTQIDTLSRAKDENGNYLYSQEQVMNIVNESIIANKELSIAQAVLNAKMREATTVTTAEEIAIASKLIALADESEAFTLASEDIDSYVASIKLAIESGQTFDEAMKAFKEGKGIEVDEEEETPGAKKLAGELEERVAYYEELALTDALYTETQLAEKYAVLDAEMAIKVAEAEQLGYSKEVLLAIEKDYQKKKAKLKGEEVKADKTFVQSLWGNAQIAAQAILSYGQAAGINSEDMINLQIAMAYANAYSAASAAYTKGGGFPGGVIPALLSMTTQMGQVKALENQKSEIKQAAAQASSLEYGGSFVTSGEQFLKVGDNPGGREHVNVVPLSSPNSFGDTEGVGGGTTLNISIEGNVMSKDFVEDELIDTLNEAIRQGNIITS